MANVESSSSISMEVTLTLPENEARALVEITKYGSKAFLKGYYKVLGRCYLQPYESGVVSLFETINKQLPSHLKKADEARDIFQLPTPRIKRR